VCSVVLKVMGVGRCVWGKKGYETALETREGGPKLSNWGEGRFRWGEKNPEKGTMEGKNTRKGDCAVAYQQGPRKEEEKTAKRKEGL